MRKTILLCMVVLLTFVSSPGVAFFESGGESARAVSLGGMLTGFAGDPDALWCNPAWLARLDGMAFRSTYARLFPGMENDHLYQVVLGLVKPLGTSGGFGVGVSLVNMDVASEMQGVLGYGRAWGGKLLVGAVVKVLRWSAEGGTDPVSLTKDKDFSSTSFSLNAGIVYTLGKPFGLGPMALRIAVYDVIQPNISSSGDEGGKLPMRVQGGLLYSWNDAFSAGVDVEYKEVAKRVHVGGEYRVPGSELMVRAGGIYDVDLDFDGGGLRFGLGYGFQRWTVDYAYTYSNALLLDAHRISLGYRFGR